MCACVRARGAGRVSSRGVERETALRCCPGPVLIGAGSRDGSKKVGASWWGWGVGWTGSVTVVIQCQPGGGALPRPGGEGRGCRQGLEASPEEEVSLYSSGEWGVQHYTLIREGRAPTLAGGGGKTSVCPAPVPGELRAKAGPVRAATGPRARRGRAPGRRLALTHPLRALAPEPAGCRLPA